ncbi:MAG: hypothetical protein CO098_18110 [Bacteroidetes bacterium CG_4_9_14_3_um_filter_41_19]|nr:MAG: hypothetical protein CO098_18110 [Bacteroidetes bacterium CG_4_9_14_3_um_filter_41_19]
MPSSKNKNSKYCILIMGMHRSGTSAVSGCINMLGYKLGAHIVPPGEPNEKGYFENNAINRFNEGLLDLLNARWHDTLHIPDEWWMDERVKNEQTKLAKILADEFGEDTKFIIKDPRISILLPFYLDVFSVLNISLKVIISFRNPFEVAASLKKRDNLSFSKSLLLWMDANLKAERFSRSLPRLFLDYTSLVNDPVSTILQINTKLNLNVEITKEQIADLSSYVETRLRHHTAGSNLDNQEIPELLNQLYYLLNKLDLHNTEQQDQSIFDNIYNGFYSGFRFFNGTDMNFSILLQTIDIYQKSNQYTSPSNTGYNRARYFTDQSIPLSEFWIFPTNQRTALQLFTLDIRTKDNENFSVNISETNAEKVLENGLMIFETEFPWLRVKFEKPFFVSQINCEFQFVAFSAFTYRSSVKERNLYESELLSKIEELQKEVSGLILEQSATVKRLEANILDLHQANNNLITEHNTTTQVLDAEIDRLQLEVKQQTILRIVSIKDLETEIARLQDLIKKMIKSHEVQVNKLKMKYLNQLNILKIEKASLSDNLTFISDQMNLVFNSTSWKIGRTITWPYRKIKKRSK